MDRFQALPFDGSGNWKLFSRNGEANRQSIISIVRSMKPRKLLINRLSPVPEGAARVNTLSSRYGLGCFPLHSDYVTSNNPPPYILLVAPRPRDTDTFLFDAHKLIFNFGLDFLARCLFLLHGTSPRYCRLITVKNDRLCFRYNKAIMTPQNPEAEEIANYLDSGSVQLFRVNWHQHRAVLIDNWSTFHSRGACASFDKIGLHRFAIWGEYL